jgi:N-acetylmuramoyl-L-alanine amidase
MVEPPSVRATASTSSSAASATSPLPTKPVITKALPAAVAPQPAARNSNGDRSLTRVLGLKIGTVVIDAGHGGNDQGTKGKSGLLEKDLTLDIAYRVAALLKDRLGVNVVMTRSDDTYVGLEDRTQIANKSKADLFLSIHANWNPLKTVAGIDTYYRYFSASREDLDLATRENAGTTRSVFELEDAVMKIAARAKVDESREFATVMQKSLHFAAAKENPEAKSRPVKRAPFVVLIGADMPSVLAEIGFLSNPKEEQLLNSDAHRDRLAEALYDGVDKYFTSLSHSEVARAVE